jgi:viologen exporter family transport system permease protein
LMYTVVPLGFLAYVPVAVFLGKDVPLLGGWAQPLALLAGPIAVGLAILHWRWCIRSYQSGGG